MSLSFDVTDSMEENKLSFGSTMMTMKTFPMVVRNIDVHFQCYYILGMIWRKMICSYFVEIC